jgi:hypothetical protein
MGASGSQSPIWPQVYLPRQFGHKVNPATPAQDNATCGKKVALKTAA